MSSILQNSVSSVFTDNKNWADFYVSKLRHVILVKVHLIKSLPFGFSRITCQCGASAAHAVDNRGNAGYSISYAG